MGRDLTNVRLAVPIFLDFAGAGRETLIGCDPGRFAWLSFEGGCEAALALLRRRSASPQRIGFRGPNVRKRRMPNRRSVEGEYRVEGSVLDAIGLDQQSALELKLKASLHQKILQLVRRRGYRARDLERILQIQQPRVSELTRGKLSTLSVARLLLDADLLGAEAEVKLRKARAHAAA